MNDLVLLPDAPPDIPSDYRRMLVTIDRRMPAAVRDAGNFHKSHSQFMNVTLDITAITPIRSIKHTLAEIERTRQALQEASFAYRKNDVLARRKRKAVALATDEFDRELFGIEAAEAEANNRAMKNAVCGAIRKLSALLAQHEGLLAKLGKSEITEADYEREEARYHIMTCIKQALNAARSRGGLIDEGNLIYLFDLGISAAQAQAEVTDYLKAEQDALAQGNAPTHEATMRFLEACADKWADDPRKFAARRGFALCDDQSLLKENLP